jgi:anti-anti-sigma factor
MGYSNDLYYIERACYNLWKKLCKTDLEEGMDIVLAQQNQFDIVQVTGRVDSFTAPKLAEAFQTLMRSSRYKIIFDMSGIDYVSSAGLRVMIDIQKTCHQSGKGELVLVGVPRRIHETLELAGFLPLFRSYGDTESALAQLE